MLSTRSSISPSLSDTLSVSQDEIGWLALGPTIAVTILSTTVVALRWYTRAVLAHCIGNDDFIILCSLALAWAMCIVMGFEYNAGFGDYTSHTVDKEQLAKLIIVNNDIWCLATNITKASIIAQYLRIFPSPVLRYTCSFILALLLLSASWGIFAGTFLCAPIEKLWKPETPGHCMDPLTYWMAAAGVNSGLDLAVLILPLPWLVTLNVPRRQKICIISLFVLGLLVVIISSIRFTTVYLEAIRSDHVRSGMYAILWSAIEVNIGIICASLLALKPLIVRLFPTLLEPPQRCITSEDIRQRRGSVFREVFAEVTRHEGYTEITYIAGVPTASRTSSRTSTEPPPSIEELKECGVTIHDFA